MMRRWSSVAALGLLSAPAYAEAPFALGQLALTAGAGLGRAPLPLFVGVDAAVHADATVGGAILVATQNYGLVGIARADYHWNRLLGIPRTFDFYLGAGVVVADLGLYPRIELGGRWFFTERTGVYLELGGGRFVDGLLGITVKLNR